MSYLSNYHQWKDRLTKGRIINVITQNVDPEPPPVCVDCHKPLVVVEINKYDAWGGYFELYKYRYQIWGDFVWQNSFVCDTCLDSLTQHLEQKRIQRYYTYLVFTKIHPDIAQYATQHWTYLIPNIKYY